MQCDRKTMKRMAKQTESFMELFFILRIRKDDRMGKEHERGKRAEIIHGSNIWKFYSVELVPRFSRLFAISRIGIYWMREHSTHKTLHTEHRFINSIYGIT